MKYRINYTKVISQAESIANDVTDLSTQLKLLNQIEQDCRTIWKGEAADEFIAKLLTLRTEINKTKNQLYNLSLTIKYCAEKIRHEEMQTKSQAETLKYRH